METKNHDLPSLFKQFENDIVFDCHSLRAKVSRSESGKQIIILGPKMLIELANHFKNWIPPSEIQSLSDEVKCGWGVLLSWMCKEHSLNRENIPQGDFESWVNWTTKFALSAA